MFLPDINLWLALAFGQERPRVTLMSIGFAGADDSDANGVAGTVFFHFVQEFFDAVHAFVFNGDDLVGRFLID